MKALAEVRTDWTIARLCAVLGVARSSLYYQPVPPALEEAQNQSAIREAVLKIAGQWPTYGYRRITAQLRREGIVVNGKCVRRLMGHKSSRELLG